MPTPQKPLLLRINFERFIDRGKELSSPFRGSVLSMTVLAASVAAGIVATVPAYAAPHNSMTAAAKQVVESQLSPLVSGYNAPVEQAGTTAVVRNADDCLEAFTADGSGAVWHRKQNSPGSTTPSWTEWTKLPGGDMYKVAAEVNDDGRIELAGLDSTGQAWHRWQTTPGGNWSSWDSLGGTGFQSVALARNKDGRLDAFAVDNSGRVNIRSQSGPGHTFPAWAPSWLTWAKDGLQQIAADTNDDGRVEIFATDANGQIWHRWQTEAGGNWSSDWSSFDGAGFRAVATGLNKDGRLDLYATNSAGQVNVKWQLDRGTTFPNWSSGWSNLGGEDVRSFAAEANDDGRLEIIAISKSGDAQHIWQKTPAASWSAWDSSGLPGDIRWTVKITDGQLNRFIEAVNTNDTTVKIAGDTQLNFDGLTSSVEIASGVKILGDLADNKQKKPRIFRTVTAPKSLFYIPNDNVRISGLRLDGGLGTRQAETEEPDTEAIRIDSSLNIEVDHNEISGWRGAAVQVMDENGRINRDNAHTVHVHDNFIHHNQHQTGDIFGGGHGGGYGVETSYGAYALVEENTFDFNRHAISSDGRPGSGYLAYRNLVLPNGGWNTDVYHTHMIDVHARENCFPSSYNCGLAGEFFDIRMNTVLYTSGAAVKLRGTPSDRMIVSGNVFSHSDRDSALVQNESGMNVGRNTYGLIPQTSTRSAVCDFNGDGTNDNFFASGNTWWYGSSNQGYTYLRDSSTLLKDVTDFGDKNSDGLCDVQVGTQIFYTPEQ
ncbi:hypothetical protein ABT272_43210 [Streptomyces sp900105245]|uniref:PLL-like beta propeller domain-containing protein n=1 Tax=Streptomyces sp. 900105245 TaxID=3154379 RepID=A0ABV1ULG9_9ACTN